MSKDSLSELSERLKAFAVARDWEQFQSPKNLAMAISGECGELVEHFQWLSEQQSYELSTQQLREVGFEMADILIYMLRMAERLNVDLIASANEKMDINEDRFPVDKVKGKAARGEKLSS